MREGYLRAAAASPRLCVADTAYNAEEIIKTMKAAAEEKVKLLVFPELCLTGYTCGDLFLQKSLLDAAKKGLKSILKASEGLDLLTVVGLPYVLYGKLYNTAAFLKDGQLLGLVPKSNIPGYTEFYETRYFTSGAQCKKPVRVETGLGDGSTVLFGTNLLFRCENVDDLIIAAELCEDVWVANSPSARHAEAGATVIVNPSASDETAGKAAFRRDLVRIHSAKLLAAYLYAGAGTGESSTDLVFSGHRLIAEDGTLLCDSGLYTDGFTAADIDLWRLSAERRRMNTFAGGAPYHRDTCSGGESVGSEAYGIVPFRFEAAEKNAEQTAKKQPILRLIDPHPFVPAGDADRAARCREIFDIQAHGLAKRLKHIGAKRVVIGLSGGLDSTLALLVTRRAYEIAGLSAADILCITMPAFGTTDRTYQNACTLAREVGAELREINISKSVRQHFSDIGHDESVHNAAYENGQARERTQILMDTANDIGGIVIGTGDLSEMALGWCTYNGDHMSMYAVNADVPKTLVRYLVRFCADTEENSRLRAVLYDVLDTPVSPELLPATADGKISQKTEDIVGPYELHDFILYNMLRFGYPPRRILAMAEQAFSPEGQSGAAEGILSEAGEFSDDRRQRQETPLEQEAAVCASWEKALGEGVYPRDVILKWMRVFYQRFFSQQFKRSCSVDGPKVGSVDLSPRGGFRMPSDAVVRVWLEEVDRLQSQGHKKSV